MASKPPISPADLVFVRSWVDVAIERLGGPTKASNRLGVSNQAIHGWKSRGVMPTDSPEARARLLTVSKETGIEPLALIGLTGPASAGGDDGNGKKHTTRASSTFRSIHSGVVPARAVVGQLHQAA